MEIFKLYGSIFVNTDDAKKSISDTSKNAQELGEKLEKLGGGVQKVGDNLTKYVSVPIAGVATASAKMAIDFEDAVAKVSTIADTNQVSMDKLKSQIVALSNETGMAASDIAEDVYNAISAGQETADAVAFVGNAAKLATAGFTDSASALDVLTTTLNAYGMESKEVTRVSDMLIQTQNMGKTTVGELASSIGKVIPTAKNANVALEQVTTAYAKLTANGIKTAESTTYLNSMINELDKSGTGVSKILIESTGKSFRQLMQEGKSLADVLSIVDQGAKDAGKTFSDVWSSAEAGKAASVIYDTTNKLGDFNAAVAQMNNASELNATDQAFEKMQTSSFNLQKTLNELKNTGIELGTTIMQMLAPYISDLSEKVHKLSEWFNGLNENQKKNIVTIGAIIVAIGPLLSIVGKFIIFGGKIVAAWGAIAPVLSTVKVGLDVVVGVIGGPLLIAIGAVSAAILVWVTNFEEIKESLAYIAEDIVAGFKWMGDKISEIANKAKAAWQNIIGANKDANITVNTTENKEVKWHAKAMNRPMIMTSPTVFGMSKEGNPLGGGEAGSEVVSGTDTLMGMIGNAVAGNSMSRDMLVSAIMEALTQVTLNMNADLSANRDNMFESMRIKNAEFKKMHTVSAF